VEVAEWEEDVTSRIPAGQKSFDMSRHHMLMRNEVWHSHSSSHVNWLLDIIKKKKKKTYNVEALIRITSRRVNATIGRSRVTS
jgi:hypothetical protein